MCQVQSTGVDHQVTKYRIFINFHYTYLFFCICWFFLQQFFLPGEGVVFLDSLVSTLGILGPAIGGVLALRAPDDQDIFLGA